MSHKQNPEPMSYIKSQEEGKKKTREMGIPNFRT
jgi:hypothetical protein